MSYLKRWRQYTAEVQALAAESSDTESSDNQSGSISEEIAETNSVSDSTLHEDEHHPIPVTDEDHSLTDPIPVTNEDHSSTDESVLSISDSDDDDDSSHGGNSDNGDEEEDVPDLGTQLAEWATRNKCTRSAVNEFLDILRKQGHRLPKDARTLLNTPRHVANQEKCGGRYKYLGLEIGLLNSLIQHPTYNEVDEINLMFNIDGVPLYKSNNMQLWPILCSVDDLEPFIVSLFYGNSKPNSVNEYLSEFLIELMALCDDGLNVNDRLIKIKVKAFVCDAPARSFLKCVKGHTAYYSCERCVIKGTWDGRVVYNIPEEDEDLDELRTDEGFAGNRYYPEHQVAPSPLLDANILCIESFSLDYMHLVCLGVVKRILMFLKTGPRESKLSNLQLSRISARLEELKGKMPREFARQPRSLSEMDRWKATEFRQFLLYTGPVVLRSVVSKELYEHFLTLTVAISILLSSNNVIRNSYLEYANQTLKYFVRKAKYIYGNTFVSYNVHALIHIADDAKNLECSLNEISAFKFENHLQKIKKCVRNAKKSCSSDL